ncbi:hypothetical protein KC717_00065 [Candidatus Dojkabacteria bacterium]|uniref:Uncharacterized protein n=1 Tax=Candidatus Dojkabacteria bacterium TaxID=2099670 RepID=A0A955L749_9BACT|nr:hypothetical protein [Candidatus Dojkabacteria bacterium]
MELPPLLRHRKSIIWTSLLLLLLIGCSPKSKPDGSDATPDPVISPLQTAVANGADLGPPLFTPNQGDTPLGYLPDEFSPDDPVEVAANIANHRLMLIEPSALESNYNKFDPMFLEIIRGAALTFMFDQSDAISVSASEIRGGPIYEIVTGDTDDSSDLPVLTWQRKVLSNQEVTNIPQIVEEVQITYGTNWDFDLEIDEWEILPGFSENSDILHVTIETFSDDSDSPTAQLIADSLAQMSQHIFDDNQTSAVSVVIEIRGMEGNNQSVMIEAFERLARAKFYYSGTLLEGDLYEEYALAAFQIENPNR